MIVIAYMPEPINNIYKVQQPDWPNYGIINKQTMTSYKFHELQMNNSDEIFTACLKSFSFVGISVSERWCHANPVCLFVQSSSLLQEPLELYELSWHSAI